MVGGVAFIYIKESMCTKEGREYTYIYIYIDISKSDELSNQKRDF